MSLGYTDLYKNPGYLSFLIGSFGSIFIALKYKLDQASFNKTLFEERYAIFLILDEVLSNCFQDLTKNDEKADFRHISKELDSVFRKSFFLFSKKTYKFISDFRQAVLIHVALKDTVEWKKNEAWSFLISLVDKQKLAEHFPELRIDLY